jgi:hypothetical protein
MGISRFGRHALVVCAAIAMLGCGSARGNNFVATDYNKPGHPSLSFAQMSIIREALDRVKPCQRTLVRYAVLGPNTDDLILFFAVPHGQGSHVFGTAIEVYFPDNGTEIPMGADDPQAEHREKQGIQWDIDHQPCPHPT